MSVCSRLCGLPFRDLLVYLWAVYACPVWPVDVTRIVVRAIAFCLALWAHSQWSAAPWWLLRQGHSTRLENLHVHEGWHTETQKCVVSAMCPVLGAWDRDSYGCIHEHSCSYMHVLVCNLMSCVCTWTRLCV